jgi:hypothetical protein
MSRSRRKLPFTSITTSVSEKEDKQLAHRKERHLNPATQARSREPVVVCERWEKSF